MIVTDYYSNVIPFPDRGMVARPPSVAPVPQAPSRLRVRVELVESDPPIWRRLDLASDLTLADLHEVLQTAMGWTDSHLHQFFVGPERDYTVQPFLTDFSEDEVDVGIHERTVRLDQVLVNIGDRLFYDYDFGDGWEHTIRIEETQEYDATAPQARVLDGGRACPPEDCGGLPGYEQLLDALAAGRSADEHQRELLDWLGEGYDPESFSALQTDELLQLTMSSLGGAEAVESALELTGHEFSATLGDLVERSRRASKPLAALLMAADLTRLDEPDRATQAKMIHPWQHLLGVIGSGLRLTPAGWLPPAVVTRIATDLDLLETWMGKGNREEHLPPVRKVRETATQLGLVRKRKGELLPTALGTRLAGDPEALWRHVADSLPLGTKNFHRHAGAIMLLSVAAGHTPYDGICRFGPDLLWSAGWSNADRTPPDDSAAIEFARATWSVLRVAAGPPMRGMREPTTEADRQLARAALRCLTPR